MNTYVLNFPTKNSNYTIKLEDINYFNYTSSLVLEVKEIIHNEIIDKIINLIINNNSNQRICIIIDNFPLLNKIYTNCKHLGKIQKLTVGDDENEEVGKLYDESNIVLLTTPFYFNENIKNKFIFFNIITSSLDLCSSATCENLNISDIKLNMPKNIFILNPNIIKLIPKKILKKIKKENIILYKYLFLGKEYKELIFDEKYDCSKIILQNPMQLKKFYFDIIIVTKLN